MATRRLAAWVWRELGRPLVEMSRILGIGSSAMSRLDERRAPRRPIDHQPSPSSLTNFGFYLEDLTAHRS